MKNLEEIKEVLNGSLPDLKSKFGIKTLWIFGSYLWGGQGKTSDILRIFWRLENNQRTIA